MILAFNPKFVEPILSGSKIHTLREDKPNRWGGGRIINFATGVRTPQYKQFYLSTCTGKQSIYIDPVKKEVRLILPGGQRYPFRDAEIEELSKNDGFNTVQEFWEWFDTPFWGQIIHWTFYRY